MRRIVSGHLVGILVSSHLGAQTPDYQEAVQRALEAGNLAKVKDICRLWTQAEPKNYLPRVCLGRAYLEAEFFDRAAEQFERARELNGESPEPACGMGDVFLAGEKPADAIREYQAALELSENYPPALTGIAGGELLRRDFAAAEDFANRALSVKKDYVPAVCLLGTVFREQGHFEVAARHYRHSLRLDKTCADAAYGLAVTFEASGNADRAQTAWRRFLGMEPDSRRARAVKAGLVVVRRRFLRHSAQRPAPSPDGKRFVFMGVGEQDGCRLFVSTFANPDAAKPITPLWPVGPNGMPDFSQDPDWSPDGKRVLFLRHRENTNNALYVVSPSGKENPELLTDKTPITGGGLWSPDGSRILFTVLEPEICPWVMNADGTNCRPLPASKLWSSSCWGSDWHPDGERIVCTVRASDRSPQSDLFLRHIETGEERRITATRGVHHWPVFTRVSPDGSKVAYARNLEGTRWRGRKRGWSVRVALVRNASLDVPIVPITHFWPISQWMPDGRGYLAITNVNQVTLLEFGGLDQRPLRLDLRHTPRGLKIAVQNCTQEVQELTLTYELFNPDSVRIASGQLGPPKITLEADRAASYTFRPRSDQNAGHTIKLVAVTHNGERVIELIDGEVR